jgi:YidC/Oxa1 family membrane protein insertase
METIRLILIASILAVALLLWDQWLADYPSVTPTTTQLAGTTSNTQISALPPSVATTTTAATTMTTVAPSAVTPANLIEVHTDVLNATIDAQGGNIVKVTLPKYPTTIDQPNNPFMLLNNDPKTFYVAQSGLLSQSGPDTARGQANYTATQNNYTLPPGQNDLVVQLTWKNKGLLVTKDFHFTRGSYLIPVNYQITNNNQAAWSGQFYAQLQRKKVPPTKTGPFSISNTYLGAAISSPDKRYEQVSFNKMDEEDLNRTVPDGWIAMLQHYFLSAWIPKPDETHQFYSKASSDEIYTIGMIGNPIQVAPGQTVQTGSKIYIGPEETSVLKKIAPGLDLTVDYGVLWFISMAIFGLMKHIYHLTGNWGWSIVLVTLMIKLLFYKLSETSYRSMAAMRKMQPKIQALKERYGDDKQKLTQATMELYKKEKINPLGGCLPMLVQIPVFLALYWVLVESVELRQAPFILWIHDLSVKDPYYVLPILMGLTIFIQQKMSPASLDPMQARMMMMLPVIFTALFLSFPAGLVLYWVVNNSLSIIQQWYIMRRVDAVPATSKK